MGDDDPPVVTLGTEPSLSDVMDVLTDADCRRLLAALSEPRTASELSRHCDLPRSTTYRKLDLLCDAGLIDRQYTIRDDGKRTARYERQVETIRVSLDDGSFDFDVGFR